MNLRGSSQQYGKQGAILIIVLVFVVLLSGLIVAYFSRTIVSRKVSDSSLNKAKADELARSALDIILGDLKQELVSSGSATGSPVVLLNPEAVPVRNAMVSGTYSIPTLLRISATTGATGLVDHLASNASTTGTSLNGRCITLARWNKHYLIPRNPAIYGSNPTKLGTDPLPGFTAPSWVFVTPQGPAVLASPTNTVVGRYAYAIYDEGALLDANVAGAPYVGSYTSGTLPMEYAGKGSTAFADLTVLGISGSTGLNNLVGWRHYASLQPGGNLASNFTFTGTAATKYRDLVLSNTNGNLRVGGTAVGGKTDQAFLSRQELIAFSRATSGSILPQDSLKYLGTFSRAVNAPSWKPTLTTGTVSGAPLSGSCTVDYAGQCEQAASVNRNIPNVRFANAGTVTHYDDKGNSSTYTVKAGDPLIQRRFSLAKLAWFGHSGPNATAFDASLTSSQQQDAIQACFGLTWNSTAWRWDYAGPTGSSAQSSIKTLDQVTQESAPREPNFFELLRAGILDGSLGRDPGPGFDHDGHGDGVYADFMNGMGTYGAPNYKQEKNMHVLQIGVNIIDQYSAHSYPTAVHLNPYGLTGEEDLAFQTVYGEKNLPYLNGLLPISIADGNGTMVSSTAATSGTCFVAGTNYCWLQPQIWNPHQAPLGDELKTGGYPAKFRTYAYGTIECIWGIGSLTYPTDKTKYTSNANGIPGPDEQLGIVYFADPGDRTSPFYGSPNMLRLDLMTTGSVAVVDQGSTPASNYISNKWYDVTTGTSKLPQDYGAQANQFVGFAFKPDTQFNPAFTITRGSTSKLLAKSVYPDSYAYFSMQYLGPDGNYHPYNFWARLCASPTRPNLKHMLPEPDSNTGSDPITGPGVLTFRQIPSSARGMTGSITSSGGGTGLGWGAIKVDPRTDRFSAAHCTWWGANASYYNSTLSSESNVYMVSGAENTGANVAFSAPCWPGVFTYVPAYTNQSCSTSLNLYSVLWSRNDPAYSVSISQLGSTQVSNAYYADPDGVVRYGDCYRANTDTGDGSQTYDWDAKITDWLGRTNKTPNYSAFNTGTSSAQARRPLILNRPFRSVGELGYAYRDLPFKSLDFWSSTSGDAALLDLFSLTDQPAVVAGQVNPNNASVPVLQAILAGGLKDSLPLNPVYATGTVAQFAAINAGPPSVWRINATSNALALAKKLVENLAATGSNDHGPYGNRADLVTRFGPLVSGSGSGYVFNTSAVGSFPNCGTTDWANKAYAEAPVRALADVTNTRTWNLLIDVIAQSGKFTKNATDLTRQFVVAGERRYWLHVAIDRFTGQIVDQQLEPVYE